MDTAKVGNGNVEDILGFLAAIGAGGGALQCPGSSRKEELKQIIEPRTSGDSGSNIQSSGNGDGLSTVPANTGRA